jgi:hypothetical protein
MVIMALVRTASLLRAYFQSGLYSAEFRTKISYKFIIYLLDSSPSPTMSIDNASRVSLTFIQPGWAFELWRIVY